MLFIGIGIVTGLVLGRFIRRRMSKEPTSRRKVEYAPRPLTGKKNKIQLLWFSAFVLAMSLWMLAAALGINYGNTGVLLRLLPAFIIIIQLKGAAGGPGLTCIAVFEITLFALGLRSEVFFSESGYTWDGWRHAEVTTTIINHGRYPTEGILVAVYREFPLAHILPANGAVVSNISIKSATAMIVLAESLLIPFVFLTTRLILSDNFPALLSALIAASSSHLIQSGFFATPQSLGLLFFSISVMLMLKSQRRQTIAGTIALITASLALAFTHSLTLVIFMVTVTTVILCPAIMTRLFRNTHETPLLQPRHIYLLILLLTILAFKLFQTNLLEQGIGSIAAWMRGDPTTLTIAQLVENVSFSDTAMDYAGVSLIVFLCVIVLSTTVIHLNQYLTAVICTAAVLGVVYVSGEFADVKFIHPYRWMPFIVILASVIAAFGATIVGRALGIRSKVVVGLIVGSLCTSMICTYISNDGSETFSNYGYNPPSSRLLESEQAFFGMLNLAVPTGALLTDWLPKYSYLYQDEYLDLYTRSSSKDVYFSDNVDSLSAFDAVAIREYITMNAFYTSAEDPNIRLHSSYSTASLESSTDWDRTADFGTCWLYVSQTPTPPEMIA